MATSGALSRDALAWKHDLEVIVTGRDADALRTDAVLLRYHVDRATFHLAPTLARVLAHLGHEGASEADIAAAAQAGLPSARALARTFAATGGRADALAPLARSAVATLTEHLFALASQAPAAGAGSGLVDELAALAGALSARA